MGSAFESYCARYKRCPVAQLKLERITFNDDWSPHTQEVRGTGECAVWNNVPIRKPLERGLELIRREHELPGNLGLRCVVVGHSLDCLLIVFGIIDQGFLIEESRPLFHRFPESAMNSGLSAPQVLNHVG